MEWVWGSPRWSKSALNIVIVAETKREHAPIKPINHPTLCCSMPSLFISFEAVFVRFVPIFKQLSLFIILGQMVLR